MIWLLLLSCGRGPRPPAPDDAWSQHGFLPAERVQLVDELRDAVKRGQIAGGSVIVVHEGTPILESAWGLSDVAAGRPFTSDDPLRVASLSKTMLATTVALLVHRGQLDLDAPIDRTLPEWSQPKLLRTGEPVRPPTLRELLLHTGGLEGNTRHGEEGQPQEDPAVASRRLAARGLHHRPGGAQAYSGEGYVLVAAILQTLRPGGTFEDVVRDTLLTPLGMTRSGWHDARGTGPIYQVGPTGLTVLAPAGPATPWPHVNPAGDGVASAWDLARLFAFHERGGVINGARVAPAEALAPLYQAPPGEPWAMGFRVHVGEKWGHPGVLSHPGASGILAWIDPDCDLAVVVAVQTWIEDSLKARLRMLETMDRACRRRAARVAHAGG